mmetsp:Transcript_86035/g.200046  ORF Transcript_86035/g.200046 Transcript_86035/m.200046 type:complete len:277 (-) Transcript_86035:257-1087(-)|eukprot:CAMPEP_0171066864 /NCGR_PEP_ID=MMETSP0766_2-20121228/7662_1 /TAXON_ID=439317 /ORGANISM="Gambierdiscus australes, Strain CAWD 149" /LENGTH=276 /DNA_ID=CAMNT_0011523055 /DNA_START=26 /DNA_END=856 /DNA_ORIENTATION=-
MDGPPVKRARQVLEELRRDALRDGEAVLHELPSFARGLQAQISERFTYETLDEADEAFSEMCTLEAVEEARDFPRARELIRFMRAELDDACRRFTTLEAWLKLKTPKVEDGNNFGVDVQRQFLSVVQDYRNYAYKELCALKNHSWNRAVVSESMEHTVTEEISECRNGLAASALLLPPASRDDDGGAGVMAVRDPDGAGSDSVIKSTRMVRQNTNKSPHITLYRRYFKDLEVEFYFKLRHTARNLALYYMNAYDMFEKNWEKVVLPRGQGMSGIMY